MPLALRGEHLLFLVLCLEPIPQIIDLAWIGPKVEELSAFLAEKLPSFPSRVRTMLMNAVSCKMPSRPYSAKTISRPDQGSPCSAGKIDSTSSESNIALLTAIPQNKKRLAHAQSFAASSERANPATYRPPAQSCGYLSSVAPIWFMLMFF